ncbi:hypothetical protein HO133_009290 [Letharia lupina]|uniref:Uncharacterized protein n=1 Tax=Letharia lupina TaxID=560253 RepID=A0A8H6CMU4_9LECA|nr:uncharacterized protein HO133_009290 [Letharia lupina]KAF6226424.1 hypothetical protein HO133_009290 [Letharia lupina]
MPAPVKATTTRSLPIDQSILLYGAVLVSASVTIPFWLYTDSMWASFTPKLNAGGGPTQEDKEIECFLAAVEEAESHNARLHSARRGQHHGDSDEDEYGSDSEDNDDDVDESDNETEGGSTLNITSCGPRNCIELDDESSGSDSEGSPARMLLH